MCGGATEMCGNRIALPAVTFRQKHHAGISLALIATPFPSQRTVADYRPPLLNLQLSVPNACAQACGFLQAWEG